jgi:hypothetical protein
MQQKLKIRTRQHLGEKVCKLVNTGKVSDSFAKHFAIHQKQRTTKLTMGEACAKVKASILWQGNPISCNKSFGKLNCSLCMKERVLILKHSRENPNVIINSNSAPQLHVLLLGYLNPLLNAIWVTYVA